MNKEEINEAIKLIKEPIIVNSVEYKFFSQENYKKLLRIYENCRWFIDNYEQVLQNIENLQHELQRKDNIINELKEWARLEKCLQTTKVEERIYDEFLDKIQELENGNKRNS